MMASTGSNGAAVSSPRFLLALRFDDGQGTRLAGHLRQVLAADPGVTQVLSSAGTITARMGATRSGPAMRDALRLQAMCRLLQPDDAVRSGTTAVVVQGGPRADWALLGAVARHRLAAHPAGLGDQTVLVDAGMLSGVALPATGDAAPGMRYQPQLCSRTGALTGLSALIGSATDAPLRQVLHAVAQWAGAGCAVPRISVPLDGACLHDPHLAEDILWEADRRDVELGQLAFAIADDPFRRDAPGHAVATLRRLAAEGARIDLSGFGCGPLEAETILRIGAGRLAIARGLVAGCDGSGAVPCVIGAVVELARQYGIDVLATGVETAGERASLSRLGCATLQGSLIAPPMTARGMEDYLHACAPTTTVSAMRA